MERGGLQACSKAWFKFCPRSSLGLLLLLLQKEPAKSGTVADLGVDEREDRVLERWLASCKGPWCRTLAWREMDEKINL
jgi:hypothetical protein